MSRLARHHVPLILGEAPSKSGDRYWMAPLSGQVGKRLCTWAGIEPDPDGTAYGRYYWPLREAFDLENLMERYPGPARAGVGAGWVPAPEARALVDDRDWTGRVVVLLGRRLAAAFGLPGPAELPWWEWTRSHYADVVVVPHPSGLTRTYNDPAAIAATGDVLREARYRADPVCCCGTNLSGHGWGDPPHGFVDVEHYNGRPG